MKHKGDRIRLLEERVARLEARLVELESRPTTVVFPTSDRITVGPVSPLPAISWTDSTNQDNLTGSDMPSSDTHTSNDDSIPF